MTIYYHESNQGNAKGERAHHPHLQPTREPHKLMMMLIIALYVSIGTEALVSGACASSENEPTSVNSHGFLKGSNDNVGFVPGGLMMATTENNESPIVTSRRLMTPGPAALPYLTIIEDLDARLDECQGDCNDDSDCVGSLVCYLRFHSESVPGCSGSGEAKMDYCANRPDNYLFYIGDGDALTNRPLGKCEGDCDADADCKQGLVCQQRGGYDPIEGCDGMGRMFADYCIVGVELHAASEDDRLAHTMGACSGDCDKDSECKDGLKCYRRSGLATVPSCVGTGISGDDYCIERQPNYLWFYGDNPSRHFPLKECEGDCDSNEECDGDLVCHSRSEYDPVPGCDGMGRHGADYCVEPMVQLTASSSGTTATTPTITSSSTSATTPATTTVSAATTTQAASNSTSAATTQATSSSAAATTQAAPNSTSTASSSTLAASTSASTTSSIDAATSISGTVTTSNSTLPAAGGTQTSVAAKAATTVPTVSPTVSPAPTASPAPTMHTAWPISEACWYVFVKLKFHSSDSKQISWKIERFKEDGSGWSSVILSSVEEEHTQNPEDFDKLHCIPMGEYKFTIMDDEDKNGLNGPSVEYAVTTNDLEVIAEGQNFGKSESHSFPLPTEKMQESRF